MARRYTKRWRRNAGDVRRWTFADIKRATLSPSTHKFSSAGQVFDERTERHGPYSGTRGVYLVAKPMYGDFDVVMFDPAKYELRLVDERFTQKEFAVWYAKHLAGVPLPSLASALKELGVENPKDVASAWIDSTKQAIVEDMRDGRVDLTVRAWKHPVSYSFRPKMEEDLSELAAYVDPRRYVQKLPRPVARAIENITYGNPTAATALLAVAAQEVDAWLSKDGAVKVLKRLVAAQADGGETVFRYNPTPSSRRVRAARRAGRPRHR